MIRDVMVKFEPGEFIAYNSQSVEVNKKFPSGWGLVFCIFFRETSK